VHFTSPRDALALGIATVYQDLAMIPLLSISRNFFLGSEPTRGRGPFRRFDIRTADRITRDEMAKMGIQLRDTAQPVGTLSGGERQSVAIARAVYFGAKVLILDEPTAALGVKEAGVVLRYIAQARARGLGVIFITHNVHHAYPIGDRFTLLNRGRSYGTFRKAEISREEVVSMMAGGEELEELTHELAEFARTDQLAGPDLAAASKALEAEVRARSSQHEP
jgi:simple sugar transport system ATP-binding protein